MEIQRTKFNLTEEVSIVRGTFFGSLGVMGRVGLLFLANLFLARVLGPESYGIWSLAFIILTFGEMIVLLGLEKGLSRFIGKYRGGGEEEKILETINSGIILVLLASLLVSFFLFLFSSSIAAFFDIVALSWMLKIVSFIFVPIALVEIIGSIFQGYENIVTSRTINSFVPSLLWLSAIGFLVVFEKIDLFTVTFSYLILFWVAGAVGIYFLARLFSKKGIKIPLKTVIGSSRTMAKPLLVFSLPLLLFNLLTLISVYVDSFFIGYFLGPYKVGIYNICLRIARLSPFLLLGTIDIFTPLMSKNLAKGNNLKSFVSELYLRATKWAFVPTLLIILTLMIFSDFFLGWFGQDFTEGALALQLLLVGYLIYAFVGPTEAMNIALGKTRFVAFYTFLGGLTSIFLNWILIPRFGIEGAAFVAVLSIVLMKLIALFWLGKTDGITLFQGKYLSFAFLAVTVGALIGFSIRHFINSGILSVIVFIFSFGLFEFIFLKKLHLIDEKDNILKDMILAKIPVTKNLSILNKRQSDEK